MSTASDVANAERWLHDARAAFAGGEAKVDKAKEQVAAAKAELPVLKAVVKDAEAALKDAEANLDDEDTGSGEVTEAHADVAVGEGKVD
jgi:multidrug resistance efflux pump